MGPFPVKLLQRSPTIPARKPSAQRTYAQLVTQGLVARITGHPRRLTRKAESAEAGSARKQAVVALERRDAPVNNNAHKRARIGDPDEVVSHITPATRTSGHGAKGASLEQRMQRSTLEDGVVFSHKNLKADFVVYKIVGPLVFRPLISRLELK